MKANGTSTSSSPATVAALPAAEFPLTAGVARETGAYGSDAHYELVLGALVEGLRVGSEP